MNTKTAHTQRTRPASGQRGPSIRAIFACALVALIGVSCAFAARPARADDASLTILRQDGLDAAYDGYLLFCARIDDDDHMHDITWPSDVMCRTVLAVLDSYGYQDWFAETYPHGTERDSARAAAEFLTSALDGREASHPSESSTDRLPTRAALSCDLARTLTGSDALIPQTAWANEPFVGQQGYWLFVSHADEANPVGTAPLFVTMGGSTASITEKASDASLSAEVREDATGSWGQTADAQRRQLVSHRLTVTLPHNLDAYDQYHCHIDCTLPEGMTLHVPQGSTCTKALSMSVGARNVDTDSVPLTASYEGNMLSVDIPDLIDPAWDDYGPVGDGTLTIAFDAYLNDSAKVGSEGNLCYARLTSTIDPVRGRETTTAPANTMVFAYALDVLKVDEQQGGALAGASFTLAELGSDSASTVASYVQADGSAGPQPYQFVTDDKGALHISCLDEGRYLLRETAAPEGYQLPSEGIELHLEAERIDKGLSLNRMTVSVASGVAEVTAIDESSATATIRIRNARVAQQATAKTSDDTGTPKTVRQLAQTGVGALSIALVGIGLAIRGLGAFPLPSEAGRKRRESRTRKAHRRR